MSQFAFLMSQFANELLCRHISVLYEKWQITRHSVMRIVLVISILTFVVCCKTPSVLQGRYSTAVDLVGTEYFFNTDSTFSRRGWSCMSRDTGCGTYLLTRDSLILTYRAISPMPEVTIDTIKTVGIKSSIRVHCTDEGYNMPYVVVFTDKRKGVVTDTNGVVTFFPDSLDFPMEVTCAFVGYKRAKFVIEYPGNYSVDVRMLILEPHVTPGGTVERYEIKCRRENKLCLKYTFQSEGKAYQSQMILNRVR